MLDRSDYEARCLSGASQIIHIAFQFHYSRGYMWIRAKLRDKEGNPLKDGDGQIERVFNLDQAKSWRGHGDFVELDMGGAIYWLAVPDNRMEILTGSSGHYADG